MQVKLLRVLQEGTFIPVGGTREKKINVRVLAATNQDLKDMIKKKLFREDLYFRLNVFNLKLPSLRDRPSDIPIIAKHYVNLFSQNLGFGLKFLTPSCIDTLMSYAWPGNIRELRNEMERLCVLSGDENCLLADYLSPDMRESLVPNYSHENNANGAQFAHGLLDMVDEFRREKITAALKASPQNFTQAARLLRFTPQGLRRLMKALGMNENR